MGTTNTMKSAVNPNSNHPQGLTFDDIQHGDVVVYKTKVCAVIATRFDSHMFDALLQEMGSNTLDTYTLSLGSKSRGIFNDVRKIGTVQDFDYEIVTTVTVWFGLWNYSWKRAMSKTELLDYIVGSSIDADPVDKIEMTIYEVKYDVFAWHDGYGGLMFCHDERHKEFIKTIVNDYFEDADEMKAIGVLTKETMIAKPNATHRKIKGLVDKLNNHDVYVASEDAHVGLWDVTTVEKFI